MALEQDFFGQFIPNKQPTLAHKTGQADVS
jgi:hypothetical protein